MGCEQSIEAADPREVASGMPRRGKGKHTSNLAWDKCDADPLDLSVSVGSVATSASFVTVSPSHMTLSKVGEPTVMKSPTFNVGLNPTSPLGGMFADTSSPASPFMPPAQVSPMTTPNQILSPMACPRNPVFSPPDEEDYHVVLRFEESGGVNTPTPNPADMLSSPASKSELSEAELTEVARRYRCAEPELFFRSFNTQGRKTVGGSGSPALHIADLAVECINNVGDPADVEDCISLVESTADTCSEPGMVKTALSKSYHQLKAKAAVSSAPAGVYRDEPPHATTLLTSPLDQVEGDLLTHLKSNQVKYCSLGLRQRIGQWNKGVTHPRQTRRGGGVTPKH